MKFSVPCKACSEPEYRDVQVDVSLARLRSVPGVCGVGDVAQPDVRHQLVINAASNAVYTAGDQLKAVRCVPSDTIEKAARARNRHLRLASPWSKWGNVQPLQR